MSGETPCGPSDGGEDGSQEKHLAWLSDIHIRDITFLGSVKFPIFLEAQCLFCFFF